MKLMARFLTILATGVLSAVFAQAQFAPMTLKASVPFDFSVESKAFPAGDYIIQRTAPHTLTLRNADGKFLTLIQTNQVQSLDPKTSASIRFRTVGGQHVLEQVWQEGVSVGYQLYVPVNRKNLVATRVAEKEQATAAGAGHDEGRSGHER